jgi:hypothetical protein
MALQQERGSDAGYYTPAGSGQSASVDAWAEFYRTTDMWQQICDHNLERLRAGSLDLSWIKREDKGWGMRAKPSAHGLTMADINRNPIYGTVPEEAGVKNFAPRGSLRDDVLDKMPTLDAYDLTHKTEVWADNVGELYEEAKARQWNAASDIPWGEQTRLSDDLETAMCQFSTVLTEVEFVAGDFPAKWMWRIPNDFFEVKSFLSTQIVDEARHEEVFRKRAVSNGGGLLKPSAGFEWALKAILDAPSHTLGTFLLNLLGEGLVLTLFRAGEMLGKTEVDKEIFRRCMQDEARHVSYGTLHVRYFIEHAKDREKALADLHAYADVGEKVILTSLTEPMLLEPLAVLMGGGLDKIDEGLEGVGFLWSVLVQEYLDRCERAGFDRRDRVQIPLEFPYRP